MNRLYGLSDAVYKAGAKAGRSFEFNQGRSRKNGSLIRRAAASVRSKSGYSKTDQRTRSLDTIFRKKSGGLFTIQGNKIVAYRGKKGRTSGTLGMSNG